MEKERRVRAERARARKRREARERAVRLTMALVLCMAAAFAGAMLLRNHMANGAVETGMAITLPTQVPQGGLTPAQAEYLAARATTAPTAEPDAETIWKLMLVNARYALPEGYAPTELTVLSNGQSVDKRMYPALQQMFDDARAQGVYPLVRSGYRTSEQQQELLNERIAGYVEEGYSAEEAAQKAAEYVAQPGHSEHETGLAVDINANTDRSTSDEVYAWLAEHAAEYGFILRYPEDKVEVTGIGYEPWHYRYVGTEAAQAIMSAGICLEEYLGVTD